MPLTMEGPRVLLRRLRQVMADRADRQTRLDKIVELIATSMNTAVCSVYLKSNEDTLELCATEGLNPSSVHKTTLKIGQGLVGDVALHARPLNLAEAKSHPRFVYLPETGEEAFQSFVGVPILSGGTVIGVLVVQNTSHRSFVDEEIEALQTVAMVLSEMLAAEGQFRAVDENLQGPARLVGYPLTEGLAIGQVVMHEPRVAVESLIAEDMDVEFSRLEAGIYELRRAVDEMLRTEDVSHAGDHLDVLETYRMFANDEGWFSRMREAVRTGLTAEAAVERVQNDIRARLTGQRDVYLRERLHDFEDLSNRLLRVLVGKTLTASAEKLPKNAILVARNMGPAELLDYERQNLRGLVIEEGTASAHVSIVARALGIPTIGRIVNIVNHVTDGQSIVVDADLGVCFLNPSSEVLDSYNERIKLMARRQKQYARLRKQPAITRDHKKINLAVNAGLMVDVSNMKDSGAEGIGLFRTELQFMISAKLPKAKEQTAFYSRVMDMVGDQPIIFRTVDIGGDKMLPYMRQMQEENPAMGWRAIRIALDRPGLMRIQIRALLDAAQGRNLQIMFPMIAIVDEFLAARDILDKELARLKKSGQTAPKSLKVGAMLEVPSLIWQLDDLLPHLDFVSVGTNDLFQFFFASDRGNPRVGERYDLFSSAPLAMMKHIADTCKRHDKPATICGEYGGRPLEAMALLGLGFSKLSVPPTSVGPVKRMIRSLNLEKLQGLMKNPPPHITLNSREGFENLAEFLRVKL